MWAERVQRRLEHWILFTILKNWKAMNIPSRSMQVWCICAEHVCIMIRSHLVDSLNMSSYISHSFLPILTVLEEFVSVIEDLVFGSYGETEFPKSLECMKHLRSFCLKNDFPLFFNDWLRKLKDKLSAEGKTDLSPPLSCHTCASRCLYTSCKPYMCIFLYAGHFFSMSSYHWPSLLA